MVQNLKFDNKGTLIGDFKIKELMLTEKGCFPYISWQLFIFSKKNYFSVWFSDHYKVEQIFEESPLRKIAKFKILVVLFYTC